MSIGLEILNVIQLVIKKNKKYVTKRGIAIYMTHFLYIILEYTINYIHALPR